MPNKNDKIFVLSDGSVNSYGFRVDMEKLNLTRFKKNPVMLYNHYEVIGRWKDIKIENGKLLASPVFTRSEKFPEKIKNRVEQDVLKGASIGMHISEHYHDGKSYIVTAEVTEASIVDVPANKNAIALYNKDGVILENKELEFELSFTKQEFKKKNMDELKEKIIKELGLPANCADEQLIERLGSQKSELSKLRSIVKKNQDDAVEHLLSRAVKEGKLEGTQLEMYRKLANEHFELAQSTISLLPPKKTLVGKEQQDGGESDRSNWSFDDWRKKDVKGLLQIKAEDPENYKKILKTINR